MLTMSRLQAELDCRDAFANFRAAFRAELMHRHALRPNSNFKYLLKQGAPTFAFFLLPKVQESFRQAVLRVSLPSSFGKEKELLSSLK
jgi:hypothetical protein